MSYEKQTWTTGDTITAEKLNHMEDGIENNGTLVVNAVESGDIITLDKTWQEIYDAFPNVCILETIVEDNMNVTAKENIEAVRFGEEQGETFYMVASSHQYVTNSPNNYPSYGGKNPK